MSVYFRKLVLTLIILTFPVSSAFSLERLVIPGTGDSQELLREAAVQFALKNPGITIDIPDSVGSIGGIKRVLNNQAPLARIARPLSDKEMNSGLKSGVFAYTPVVFVANLPEACIKSLTTAEIIAIYSGEIDNWNQLGNCPSHKIYVANREEGDSSRLLIEENLPGYKSIAKFAGEVLYSTPDALHIVEDHPYTIGYLPQAMLKNSPLTQLAINNLRPTAENLAAKKYPLAVPLGFVWKNNLSESYKNFIEFMFSSSGQETIRAHNAVPAPKPSEF